MKEKRYSICGEHIEKEAKINTIKYRLTYPTFKFFDLSNLFLKRFFKFVLIFENFNGFYKLVFSNSLGNLLDYYFKTEYNELKILEGRK